MRVARIRTLPSWTNHLRILVAGLAVVSAFAVRSGAIRAQTPETPVPLAVAAACTIPPLTLPLFGGAPADAVLATPAVFSEDQGAIAPVSGQMEQSVRDGVSMIVACINEDDPKQRFAVFTTDYLARTFGDPGHAYLPAFERSLDTLPAEPAARYAVASFSIEGQTADGRVVVALSVEADGDVWADRLLLAEVGGHWLIDAVLG